MIDPKVISKIKEDHPLDDLRRATVTAPALDQPLDLVVRVPDHVLWTKYGAALRDEKKKGSATRTFVYDCVLYPERDDLDALFAKQPGLVPRIADQLGELAGSMAKVEVEKL